MSEPLLKVENLKQHFPVSRSYTVKAVNGMEGVRLALLVIMK